MGCNVSADAPRTKRRAVAWTVLRGLVRFLLMGIPEYLSTGRTSPLYYKL